MTVLRYFLVTFFSVLVFRQNYAVEIAADKVTQHDADIDTDDLKGMSLEECDRNAGVIERISYTVGERGTARRSGM